MNKMQLVTRNLIDIKIAKQMHILVLKIPFIKTKQTHNWALLRQNLSSGYDKARFQTASPATETCYKIEISSSQVKIWYYTRFTKGLIRLCGCTCWSAPLLFKHPEDKFSPAETHIILCIHKFDAGRFQVIGMRRIKITLNSFTFCK